MKKKSFLASLKKEEKELLKFKVFPLIDVFLSFLRNIKMSKNDKQNNRNKEDSELELYIFFDDKDIYKKDYELIIKNHLNNLLFFIHNLIHFLEENKNDQQKEFNKLAYLLVDKNVFFAQYLKEEIKKEEQYLLESGMHHILNTENDEPYSIFTSVHLQNIVEIITIYKQINNPINKNNFVRHCLHAYKNNKPKDQSLKKLIINLYNLEKCNELKAEFCSIINDSSAEENLKMIETHSKNIEEILNEGSPLEMILVDFTRKHYYSNPEILFPCSIDTILAYLNTIFVKRDTVKNFLERGEISSRESHQLGSDQEKINRISIKELPNVYNLINYLVFRYIHSKNPREILIPLGKRINQDYPLLENTIERVIRNIFFNKKINYSLFKKKVHRACDQYKEVEIELDKEEIEYIEEIEALSFIKIFQAVSYNDDFFVNSFIKNANNRKFFNDCYYFYYREFDFYQAKVTKSKLPIFIGGANNPGTFPSINLKNLSIAQETDQANLFFLFEKIEKLSEPGKIKKGPH